MPPEKNAPVSRATGVGGEVATSASIGTTRN